MPLAFSPQAGSRLVELAASRMAEIRPSVLHGDFLACEAFNVTEQLGRILQPTLILCGVEDQITPPRYSQFLAGLIPNARLEIVIQAGHMVMLEQPQVVAGLLTQFLESIPISPAESETQQLGLSHQSCDPISKFAGPGETLKCNRARWALTTRCSYKDRTGTSG
jgi:hypothetical protein